MTTPDPNNPPVPAPPAEIRGACPVCHSAIFVADGAIKGGGASTEFQQLEAKAASADEWRNKAAAFEAELTSHDIDRPAPLPGPNDPPPDLEAETEYFL